MLSPVQLYFEAITAVLLMATMGVISAFTAAVITGDKVVALAAACTVMLIMGTILAARLRRLTRIPPIVEGNAASE